MRNKKLFFGNLGELFLRHCPSYMYFAILLSANIIEYIMGYFLHQIQNFRKHISTSLEHHEYLFLNSICILLIVTLYLVYLYSMNKICFFKMMKTCCSLSFFQIGAILLLSTMTVISGIILFDLDKFYKNPLFESVFVKLVGMILVICVGIFILSEEYKPHQIVGIILIIAGIYLCSLNKINFL